MTQKTGLTIGVIIIIIQVFLLTNITLFFPESQIETTRNILLSYIIIFMFGMVLYLVPSTGAKSRMFSTPLPLAMKQFLIGFLITAPLVVFFVPATILASVEPFAGQIIFVGVILMVFLKAFIEEFFFRDIIEDVLPRGRYSQAILFGIFHLAILTLSGASAIGILTGVIFLTLLGLVWSYMKSMPQFGIIGSTASHVAYNMAAIGLLIGVF